MGTANRQWNPEKSDIWRYQLVVLSAIKGSNLDNGIEEEDIVYENRGQDKWVYRVPADKLILEEKPSDLLATAVPNDQSFDLMREFQILKELYGLFGDEVSPVPAFYTETVNTKIMGMEYLNHPLIGDFLKQASDGQVLEALAEAEGYAAGIVHAKTGKFHVEPHNENMVVLPGEVLRVKFLDVDHMTSGSVDELVTTFTETYGYDRVELGEYRQAFLHGLEAGLRQ